MLWSRKRLPKPNSLLQQPDVHMQRASAARAAGLIGKSEGGRPLRQVAPGRTDTSRASTRLRDELLDGEIFYTLREAQIVIESWRRHYNTIRPNESLGYKPPAPEVFVPAFAAWPAALRQPAPPATLAPRPTMN